MKKSLLIILCIISFDTSGINSEVNELSSETDSCNNIPDLNTQIISFTNSKMNKRVGRGECWDLAAEALKNVQADWNGHYKFGRLVNPDTECVFPGDIMQFEGVKIEYEKDESIFKEDMSHHTAIIFTVNSSGNYELAHQNFGRGGKHVNVTHLELKNIKRGKFFIYRPVKDQDAVPTK